jgi:molybdopterin-guanine dinucleotide biosynthesis protein A
MITRGELTGLILAGGQARRMRGGLNMPAVEKGLLELDGMPLIEHARRFLFPHVAHILISANSSLDGYAQYGTVVPDGQAWEKYTGPLAGVASGLGLAATAWLMVMPVDVPRPPADLPERLCAAVSAQGPLIAYAETADGAHPLCMVLHRGVLQSLCDFLRAGERKVLSWQQLNGAAPVLFEGGSDVFFNINTPQDLLRARG